MKLHELTALSESSLVLSSSFLAQLSLGKFFCNGYCTDMQSIKWLGLAGLPPGCFALMALGLMELGSPTGHLSDPMDMACGLEDCPSQLILSAPCHDLLSFSYRPLSLVPTHSQKGQEKAGRIGFPAKV